MKIYIPDLTLVKTLEFAKNIFDKLSEGDEVVFDFSRVKTFDPLPMLIMGSTLRNCRRKFPDKKFSISGFKEKSYAKTMGFFNYISKLLKIGKMPGEARGSNNYIPITSIKVEKLQQDEIREGHNITEIGELMEKEAGRLARIIDRGNTELHKLLTYLIREILRNIPEHAKIDTMWICGQYWPSYEIAEIAILDEGIGIYNSIVQNDSHKEYITDNQKALQWVLKAGVSEAFDPSIKQKSRDVWANSGFGLYMVSEICKYLAGSFCIVSYGNYILIDDEGIKCGKTNFHGTAIKIAVPSRKLSSAQDVISKIASQGRDEARSIRNAFKNASMPSKGLMSELNIY